MKNGLILSDAALPVIALTLGQVAVVCIGFGWLIG